MGNCFILDSSNLEQDENDLREDVQYQTKLTALSPTSDTDSVRSSGKSQCKGYW